MTEKTIDYEERGKKALQKVAMTSNWAKRAIKNAEEEGMIGNLGGRFLIVLFDGGDEVGEDSTAAYKTFGHLNQVAQEVHDLIHCDWWLGHVVDLETGEVLSPDEDYAISFGVAEKWDLDG
jgi:hypothetical protein